MSWPALHLPARRLGRHVQLAGLLLLMLPAAVLTVAGVVFAGGWQQPALLVSALIVVMLGLGLIRLLSPRGVLLSKFSLAIYALALAWLWLCVPDHRHWMTHLATGILTTVPLLFLGLQELVATTSFGPRQAHFLLHKLSQRKEWPARLAEVRSLSEVIALRDALRDDPTPGLMVLTNPKPELRLAVLAALAYRPRWKKSQALLVIEVAKYANEPVVRTAAVTALAFAYDPTVLSHLASHLRDPVPEVRRATAEALFTDIRDRWPAVRHAVRAALGDPRCAADGALPCPGALPTLVLQDLTVWAGEIGSIGKRSTLTLIRYYRRAVQEDLSPQLIA